MKIVTQKKRVLTEVKISWQIAESCVPSEDEFIEEGSVFSTVPEEIRNDQPHEGVGFENRLDTDYSDVDKHEVSDALNQSSFG